MPHHGDLTDILNIFMRVLHIASAVALLGGAILWRFAAIPATAPLAPETRSKVGDAMGRSWRPFAIAAIAGLLISGTYNLLRKTNVPPGYHGIFGLKFLLALHVFAVIFLATQPGNEKRSRQLTGVIVSGVTIVILSAVLRWLSLA